MRGAAWMPTQELRHGREPLPEHPPLTMSGRDGASPVDPGLEAHSTGTRQRTPQAGPVC